MNLDETASFLYFTVFVEKKSIMYGHFHKFQYSSTHEIKIFLPIKYKNKTASLLIASCRLLCTDSDSDSEYSSAMWLSENMGI